MSANFSAGTRMVSLGLTSALLLAGVTLVVQRALSPDGYRVTVVMPQAPDLVTGNNVQVNGLNVGRVKALSVRDGKAVVSVSVSKEFAPLHTGTTARIEWKALLGERVFVLQPGPLKNPTIPSGGMVEGGNDRIEIDQVLAALDIPTRARLQSLVQRLQSTLRGSEKDVNATLSSAAPTVAALGAIATSLGTDGESIKNIVTRFRALTATTSARRHEVSTAVTNLTTLTQTLAKQAEPLRQTLSELPSTLNSAKQVLDTVPKTVDAVTPLLRDARPLASELGPVSRDLRPMLTDLRATLTDLRPALTYGADVLGQTPALLDNVSALMPGLTKTVNGVLPALQFVRPYTPEVIGWMSNWASATANYDSIGNYARIWVQKSAADLTETPGVAAGVLTSSLLKRNGERAPGELVHQSWTDANGSEMR
jgi:phospholipid/cholesterol/gamma-HCH transport system substrate-binding protein